MLSIIPQLKKFFYKQINRSSGSTRAGLAASPSTDSSPSRCVPGPPARSDSCIWSRSEAESYVRRTHVWFHSSLEITWFKDRQILQNLPLWCSTCLEERTPSLLSVLETPSKVGKTIPHVVSWCQAPRHLTWYISQTPFVKQIILKVNRGSRVKLFIQDQTPKGQRWVHTQQRLACARVSTTAIYRRRNVNTNTSSISSCVLASLHSHDLIFIVSSNWNRSRN